jgi:hypothetical protein
MFMLKGQVKEGIESFFQSYACDLLLCLVESHGENQLQMNIIVLYVGSEVMTLLAFKTSK